MEIAGVREGVVHKGKGRDFRGIFNPAMPASKVLYLNIYFFFVLPLCLDTKWRKSQDFILSFTPFGRNFLCLQITTKWVISLARLRSFPFGYT